MNVPPQPIVLNPQYFRQNPEKELAFYVSKKLQNKFRPIFTKIDPSPISGSYYVIVRKNGRGAVIRISDHFIKDTLTKFTGWHIGNVSEKRVYYVFSHPGQPKSRNNFYSLDELDDFFKDIEKYIEGPSAE